MANSLLKNLEELVQDEVITSETADKITKWYADQHPPREARLLAIFGVIGAILIGLGLILIVAHNWDAFPRGVKTVWAFVPLILGLAGSAYTLLKRPESVAMRESSGSFTILAVGVAISLVSQIYNIEGDLAGFLLVVESVRARPGLATPAQTAATTDVDIQQHRRTHETKCRQREPERDHCA